MLTEGQIIDDKYEIIRILGRGGTGTVYLARHMALKLERAVKEICREDCPDYEEIRQSLLREAYILKNLRHPNLPEILDVIAKKDVLFIVMEYIPGHTLKELQEQDGPVDEKTAVDWGKQLCGVLAYLHGQTPPVIYRDLKPSNVIRRPDGRLILIDFGTAREYREEGGEDTICLGTRGYAAPEQYGRGQTDERTDLYCLGATLYHLLTGKSPEEPPYKMIPIRKWDPGFSPGLEQFILTCTQADPAERYQDCEEAGYVLTHLDKNTGQYRQSEKKKIRRFLLVLAGMCLCGLFALFCRNTGENLLHDTVGIYVEQAERAADEETRREYYISALELAPSDKRIYESLQRQYVRTNTFQVKDAAELMNILELASKEKGEPPVLEVLRQTAPEIYGEFCYQVGVGYFFYMGTPEGKRAAGVWFEDACHTEPGKMESGKRQRAQLYARISSYYNTFLVSGADKSGEQTAAGYDSFFETLRQLNCIPLYEDSPSSQAAAAYMVSVEVAVEIGRFAGEFQEEGGVSAGQINAELDKICQPPETEPGENTGEDASQKAERNTGEDASQKAEANTGEDAAQKAEGNTGEDAAQKAQGNTGEDAAQKAREATAMEEESGRITILKQFRSEEEMENLKNLVEDARRKTALAAADVQRGGS